MAREFRRITFEHMELWNALQGNSGKAKKKAPKGDIVGIDSVRKDGEFYLQIRIVDVAGKENGNKVFDFAVVKEALIGHCLASGIPLPLKARKEVRTIDRHACLDIFSG